MMQPKLFLVHCGFYDMELLAGTYEFHVNFMVVAGDFEEARVKAKLIPDFQSKKMHVDGLQEIQAVGGYRLALSEDPSLEEKNLIISNRHRDLASKKSEALA